MNDESVGKILDILSSLRPDEQIQILRTVKAQLASAHLRKSDEHSKVAQEHKEYYELLKANL